MDKLQSHKIVKDTFQNQFNKDRFVFFISNLLNYYDKATFVYRGNFIPDAYEKHISTLERVGKYTDGEHKVDILIVNLKKETSIERARTMQRNFIAWYLNGSRGNEMKDAALVAFVSPNQEDWRFSLVKMDYKFEEAKSGNMKVKEEFTPARRWSFLVGKNENSHTAQSRLAPILKDDQTNPTLQQLEEAFNIEQVTKEFFEKYRELYLWTKDTLEKVIDKDKVIKENFQKNNVDTNDFAKKLLGQIVFLYFLQKKGWFGVKRDESWGTGPKNFLRQLFEKKHGKYHNFFNDILEPLFYEALARKRADDFYSRFNCKIPFLNGGLFDPINNYDWVRTDLILPNDLFSNNFKTKQGDIGNGILDVFDRYNFTVKEDEPLEKEVAVDPEMLGKVFENLLKVKDRKSKGTYYTPREIVHYMCQQSLISYLITELQNKVDKEDIEKLIKFGDSVAENEARVGKKGEETKKYYYKLPASIRKNAKLIDDKLNSIKVCDPAIGSGAFPVGMMNEIVKARTTLNAYLCEQGKMYCHNRTPYDFKFECIQNSLYGVDIDPGAVEIAKLRLWLSLVVDEDDIKQIKPLPNLDYKIMQGNSLLEELVLGDTTIPLYPHNNSKDNPRMKNLLEKEMQTDLFGEANKNKQIIEKLTQLQKEYFTKNDLGEKKKIKAEIEQIEMDLIKENVQKEIKKLEDQNKNIGKYLAPGTGLNQKDAQKFSKNLTQKAQIMNILEEIKNTGVKPFFLWHLYFADVFEKKGGFDVVIANPPYVDSETMTKNNDDFRKIYSQKYKSAKGNWDLFVIFIEKGLGLLKEKAVITYIVPNKLLAARYTLALRNLLLTKNIKEFRDFSQVDVFKEVDVYPIVFNIQNSNDKNSVVMTKMKSETVVELSNKIPSQIFYQDSYWDRYFSPENVLKIIIKISQFPVLSSLCKKVSDAATVSEAYEIKKYIKEGKGKPNKSYKKLVNTGVIDRYISLWGKSKTQYIKHGYIKPIIFDEDLKSIKLNRYKQTCSTKIIIAGMSKELECIYDKGKYLAGKSTTIILEDNLSRNINIKFLLSVLNSNLTSFWYKKFFGSLSLAGGYLQINNREIERIPIPKVNISEQKPFIKIVDKILAITKSDDYLENPAKQSQVRDYEKQIDQMVYKLYGLTHEEIKTIEQKSQ